MNPVGKKRPILRGPDGRMTPVPWLGGDGPAEGTWAYVDDTRSASAETCRLCIICGLERGDDWIYALLKGNPYDSSSDLMTRLFEGGSPSPTYGHPECILKAVLYCPHLKKQEFPAMKQDKITKLTADDLKQIVHDRKKLDPKRDSFAKGSAAFSPRIKRDKALSR